MMVHGKGEVAYGGLNDYWNKVRHKLMSIGYVDRQDMYSIDNGLIYYVTSTGLYRLNQLQEAEERRNKKLKSKE